MRLKNKDHSPQVGGVIKGSRCLETRSGSFWPVCGCIETPVSVTWLYNSKMAFWSLLSFSASSRVSSSVSLLPALQGAEEPTKPGLLLFPWISWVAAISPQRHTHTGSFLECMLECVASLDTQVKCCLEEVCLFIELACCPFVFRVPCIGRLYESMLQDLLETLKLQWSHSACWGL